MKNQFLETKSYVAFDEKNFRTFSIEYLKLIEAVCSEIDVMGKEIAHQLDSKVRISDRTLNIQKWWYVIQDWYYAEQNEPI